MMVSAIHWRRCRNVLLTSQRAEEETKVPGMRFCRVAHKDDARDLADMLKRIGIAERDMHGGNAPAFEGAVFPVAENAEHSWIEIWPAGEAMPEMTMLQIIVDDADAFAQNARKNGLEPKGPDDAHGERIYYLEGPSGLPISFQSKIA